MKSKKGPVLAGAAVITLIAGASYLFEILVLEPAYTCSYEHPAKKNDSAVGKAK